MSSADTDIDVAIIGAGPYGLSVAAQLAHRGVSARTFGTPMDTWQRKMPAGMLLKSDGFATSLTAPVKGWTLREYCAREGLPYSDDAEPRVLLEHFVEYGLAFQRELVGDLDLRSVADVALTPSGFALTLDDGETLTAGRVVVAAGITHFARLPAELSPLGDRLTHSGQHRTFDEFNGKRVAVIGAGSSAVEVTAGLIDAGAHAHLLARRAVIPFWSAPIPGVTRPFRQRLLHPGSGMGPGWRNRLNQEFPDAFRILPADFRVEVVRRHLGPASGWWLHEKVLGGADVRTQTTIRDAKLTAEGVTLTTVDAGGGVAELQVDHVIGGTGYAADIDRLTFLDSTLRGTLRRVGKGTMPALSGGFESSVPGLYFVGNAAAGTFGPLLRFVVGTEFAAPRTARSIAAHVRRRRAVAAA